MLHPFAHLRKSGRAYFLHVLQITFLLTFLACIFAYFIHMNAYECIGEILMGSLHIFAYLCIFCAFLLIFKFTIIYPYAYSSI